VTCSRRIDKSDGQGVDLSIHAELTHAMWEILEIQPPVYEAKNTTMDELKDIWTTNNTKGTKAAKVKRLLSRHSWVFAGFAVQTSWWRRWHQRHPYSTGLSRRREGRGEYLLIYPNTSAD